MSQQIIIVGATANDRTGDPIRDAFRKANANFSELYDAVAAIDPKVADAVAAAIAALVIGDVAGLQSALDSKATPADIQAAVTALIASAPGALDTLNELALALGNDPNFATTITNALAAKAPLASPAFTGTPTVPSPPLGDNSQRAVNSAWVTALVAQVAQGISYKSPGDTNTTLLSTDRIIVVATPLTAPRTWTLPTAASVSNGVQYRILDIVGGISSANTLTIAAAGGDTINGLPTRVLASPRAEAVLMSDGASTWSFPVNGDTARALRVARLYTAATFP